jgi:hypothetical protein
MKSLMLSLLVALTASFAQANTETVPEICYLQTSVDSEAIFKIQTLDVKEINSLNAGLLKLVNQHLVKTGYIPKAASFEDIKALFSEDGEYQYDDLYILLMTSYRTGEKYIEIKTYPGDNPVTLVFNSQGRLYAESGDGDYVIFTVGGKIRCHTLVD